MREPRWVVKEAKPSSDYTIEIEFSGGARRVFDASPLLEEPFFARLRELPFFLMAHAEYGTVVWTEDVDIAPERLYEASVPVARA